MSPAVDEGNDVYLGCESCGLVSRDVTGDDPALVQHCSRCGHVLHATKPYSLQRTWACIVAAAILYIPANTLPVMETVSALQRDEHTLLGGIHELWLDGSWGLAIIVFIASIAVPVLKIAVLALLAWTVRWNPDWRRLERARLYRLIETVGHWAHCKCHHRCFRPADSMAANSAVSAPSAKRPACGVVSARPARRTSDSRTPTVNTSTMFQRAA